MLRFSVVIPTYDRPEQLAECLEAVSRQEIGAESFEVLVSDDGGARPAAPVVERFRDRLAIRLLEAPRGGPGAARNRAAAEARAEWLAFTDDDCRPAADWLLELASAAERHPDAMLGGATRNALRDNLYSEMSQRIVQAVYDHGNPTPERARFFASNNFALPAAGFQRLGGFDPGFRVVASEDRDLCNRWLHAGGRLVSVPSAHVRHAHHLDLAGFCELHFRYGRGALHYQRLRSKRGSGSLSQELGFHSDPGNWMLAPLRGLSGLEAVAGAALLALWQAMNAAGFLYEAVARTGYRATGSSDPRELKSR